MLSSSTRGSTRTSIAGCLAAACCARSGGCSGRFSADSASDSSNDEARMPCPLRVVLAEAVVEEVLVGDLLHAHEAVLRQLALAQQVDDRADAGRGRDLDAAPVLVVDLPVQDRLGVGRLGEAAAERAGGADEDDDLVLVG